MIEGHGTAVFDRDSGGARTAAAVRPTSVPLPVEVPTDWQPQPLPAISTTQGGGPIGSATPSGPARTSQRLSRQASMIMIEAVPGKNAPTVDLGMRPAEEPEIAGQQQSRDLSRHVLGCSRHRCIRDPHAVPSANATPASRLVMVTSG